MLWLFFNTKENICIYIWPFLNTINRKSKWQKLNFILCNLFNKKGNNIITKTKWKFHESYLFSVECKCTNASHRALNCFFFSHWIESHICTMAHPNYHILPFYNKLKRKNFRYKNQNYIHSGINTRKNYPVIKII